MKTRTSIYKNLQFRTGTGDAYYQIRITKNGIYYDMDKIVSCDVQQMLCGSGIGVEIGQACAATCTLVLFESSANWERMAKFTVSFRIVSGDGMENTSWYDIGQFYTDTRSEDNAGRLTINAYDSMLLMEKTWTDSIPSEDLPASFPITARAWATLIQTHNLATFADLTQLDDTIAFVGLDTTSSIRDVLKSIATVHGGNWTVLANGNLKLIQYQNLVDEDYTTISGSLVHITDALAEPAKKFVADLEPVKVTGKNLFNKNDFVRNVGYIDPNNNKYVAGDGRVTAVLPDQIPVGTYTISRATSARLRVGLVTSTTLTDQQAVTNKVTGTNNSDSPVTITVSQSGYYLAIFFKDTADADEQNLLDHLQVEAGSTATSYEDYTCTLKGYTGVEVYHSDADTSNPTTIPITFQSTVGTVHGGTLDVTSGLLKAYPYYDSYNGETLTGHWISNIDEYAVGTTPTIGAQVVNDGAIPITYQITPTQITLLSGENNFWADTGNVEVTYKSQESPSTENYIDLGQAEESLETSPQLPAVTGVHLETDAGTVMEYGSDSGYVVRAVCNVATTEGITEFCLTKVSHFIYKPFTAYNVCIDPAIELGDSVIINGVGYQVMALDLRLNGLITATVSAPYDQEVDHEYAVPNKDAQTYRKVMDAVEEGMSNYVTKEEHESSLVQTEQSITATVAATYVTQEIYNDQIAEIQSQLDGAIQSWSGNAVPTLNNEPAVNWTTAGEKAEHVGDTYFVNSDAGIPEAGSYYRFENNNGVYSWQLLNDTALTEALAKAAAAQAAAEAAQDSADAAQSTADSASATAQLKGRIFVVQPTPPYDKGDLWFNSTSNDIRVCMREGGRQTGSFVESDWEKRDKYTDDSALTNFINNVYNIAIQSIQQQVDQKAETYYQDTDPSIEWGAAIAGIAIVGIDKIGVWGAEEHEGDLWFRTTDNTTWFFNGSEWVQQSVPQDVFDQIDGKAQIFVGQPYTPYRVGDLWFQSVNDDIKTCIANRLEGDFAEADWVKYNKYTDDTKANQVDQSLTTFKNTFSINPQDIRAEVEKRVIANKTETVNSFGWKLIDSAHIWYANGSEVARINQSGAYVKGEIRATTGYIGNENTGFKIEATSIRNTMTERDDTTHNGIYIGTNGIALGKGNFKVTDQGVITAKSGTIGGFTINATSMYTNDQSSYSGTGNGIYMGSSGFRIGSKFKVDTAGNVTCGNITATNGTFEGTVYAKNVQYGGTAGTLNGGAIASGTLNGSSIIPLTISGGTNGQIAHQSIGSLDIASNSISGGSGGHIQSHTLSDLNVVSSGYSPSALNSTIQGQLTSAGIFGNAIKKNSTYPSYFAAGQIAATTSVYAPKFTVADTSGGTNEYNLNGHYHSFTEQDGKIIIGPPNNATNIDQRSFSIANTTKYKTDVLASRAVLYCNATNYNDFSSGYDCDVTGSSYHYAPSGASYEYARVDLRNSYGNSLKTLRIKMPKSSGELSVSVADGGVTWNNSYKMYYYAATASATCGDQSDSVTNSWYFNPTEAIEFGKSQGGYANYIYQASEAWTSRNNHPVCRVSTVVYGVTSDGSYVQLASGTVDYERPY